MDLLGRLFRRKKDSQFLYTEALECLLQGETNDAFTKLRELVREDTENVQAYLKLGTSSGNGPRLTRPLKFINLLLSEGGSHLP